MAETKKKTTTKKTVKSAAKKSATKKAPAKKTTTKKVPAKRKTSDNKKLTITKVPYEVSEMNKLTNEAKFSVWVDVLILIFIVLMFAVILYGYIIAK